jgi:GT2 family glycosyltransferase
MKITAFIPVYSTPRNLIHTVGVLSSEAYPGSGIVIVVDGETTPEIAAALRSLRNAPGVRIVEGREHMGKAAALNLAVSETETEGIIFLDNDIIVETGMRMFRECDRILENCDIAEIPKLGSGRGILASMAKCEFLANVIATDFIVSRRSRCPAINGAAFIVRQAIFREIGGFRRVLNEDMDFAARAFCLGARAKFEPSTTVKNVVFESFGPWFKQRCRWAINSPLWAQTYMPRFKREAPEFMPDLVKSGLVFPLPFFAACVAIALQFIPGSGDHAGRILAALAGLGVFGLTASLFSSGAKKFGTRLFLPAYVLYSVFYLPVWGFAYCLGLISVVSRKIPDLDWKHSEGENFAGMEKPVRRKGKITFPLPKSGK